MQYKTMQCNTVQLNILYLSVPLGKLYMFSTPCTYKVTYILQIRETYVQIAKQNTGYKVATEKMSIWFPPPSSSTTVKKSHSLWHKICWVSIGCVTSSGMLFSLFVTRLPQSVSKLCWHLPITPLAFLMILFTLSLYRLHAFPPQDKRQKVRG